MQEENNTISLHYKKLGQGPPLLILHGLFGSLDNWQTIANGLADQFTIYLIDLRNHGKSPHHPLMNYHLMAQDLVRFVHEHNLREVNIIGHSMGGKVVMELLATDETLVHKAMVVDIGIKAYKGGHEEIFKAMFSLNLDKLTKRSEAEEGLIPFIPDFGVRQFILKNLDRKHDQKFVWKLNLEAIYQNYKNINESLSPDHRIYIPVCFVLGSKSNYVTNEDREEIKIYFSEAEFVTIENAGHWIHADQPVKMVEVIKEYFV
ncbi:MAG TPA: alpha/beta fold hydrolase [Saprospiraceae bacterium]|nr:alpha/beta fold hydrolase [Saprospiraceae bacterium]